MQNSNKYKRIELWTKGIKNIGNLGRHLPRARGIRKTPHSMYARVPQTMMQFVLKLTKPIPYQGDSPNTRNSLRFERKYIIVMTQLV